MLKTFRFVHGRLFLKAFFKVPNLLCNRQTLQVVRTLNNFNWADSQACQSYSIKQCLICLCLGCEKPDWYIPPPDQRVATGTLLTPEQTKETLTYFRKFSPLHVIVFVRCHCGHECYYKFDDNMKVRDVEFQSGRWSRQEAKKLSLVKNKTRYGSVQTVHTMLKKMQSVAVTFSTSTSK